MSAIVQDAPPGNGGSVMWSSAFRSDVLESAMKPVTGVSNSNARKIDDASETVASIVTVNTEKITGRAETGDHEDHPEPEHQNCDERPGQRRFRVHDQVPALVQQRHHSGPETGCDRALKRIVGCQVADRHIDLKSATRQARRFQVRCRRRGSDDVDNFPAAPARPATCPRSLPLYNESVRPGEDRPPIHIRAAADRVR